MVGAICIVLGCSSERGVCRANCPDLSGRYAVEETVPTGSCDFTPYLVGPTLILEQAAGEGEISAEVIDPVNQLQVLLSGEVLEGSGDGDQLGSFRLHGRITRQRRADSQTLVTLDLTLHGSVVRSGEEDRLSGLLSLVQLEPEDGRNCQHTLSFFGRRLEGSAPDPS